MEIKCRKQSLVKALQTVNAVATSRDVYPILENVKISALEKRLFFRATDLKISLTYDFPASQVEIAEEGELLVPALRLYNLVREIGDAEIVLKSREFNGVIACQDGHFTIQGEDPAKFPEIAEFHEEAAIEISGEDFQRLIKKTLFATTPEKTRYDLDNVLGEITGEQIRFVATDGKRLALCARPCKKTGAIADTKFTVPSKGLQQIEKILSATTPPTVMLNFLENQLLFRTPEVILATRLADVKFPPYERVLPKSLPLSVSLMLKDFASALRRVCLLADEKNKIVELSFTPGVLKFHTMGEGMGEGLVDVPMNYQGERLDIKFNPNFLLDVVKVIESAEIKIFLQDGQSAALLKDGEDFQYIILPIKLEENPA